MSDGFNEVPKNSKNIWMLNSNGASYVAEWNQRIGENSPAEFLSKSVDLWVSEHNTLN